jgi:hypothetical protein
VRGVDTVKCPSCGESLRLGEDDLSLAGYCSCCNQPFSVKGELDGSPSAQRHASSEKHTENQISSRPRVLEPRRPVYTEEEKRTRRIEGFFLAMWLFFSWELGRVLLEDRPVIDTGEMVTTVFIATVLALFFAAMATFFFGLVICRKPGITAGEVLARRRRKGAASSAPGGLPPESRTGITIDQDEPIDSVRISPCPAGKVPEDADSGEKVIEDGHGPGSP